MIKLKQVTMNLIKPVIFIPVAVAVARAGEHKDSYARFLTNNSAKPIGAVAVNFEENWLEAEQG